MSTGIKSCNGHAAIDAKHLRTALSFFFKFNSHKVVLNHNRR